ncbi:hypothetical protein PB2503_10014 [Parvularcula bermudensis HTCC2503]|uniref:HTH cro/C1-type domain-containing protein n=1 Tax=Parvularcula bermudensis (strain ATCC BAA-594 / HTCC2503 / KCTC 12087) TaxID=314260 RepID=E0TEW2_PARBH|nr:TonB family protein [Parvularcula bermudensis]ADM10055.1 hypothetical protein PB2503_10014 [Parvularcula bermudensis HTCC2503]
MDGPESLFARRLEGFSAPAAEPAQESLSAEGATILSADYPHAGAMLRAARDAMGLTREDVARQTKIKSERLEAIETMAIDDLPAKTYTLGFVRAYARITGLPEDSLVERFKADAGYGYGAAPTQDEPAVRASSIPKEQRRVGIASVVVLTLGIIWVSWRVLEAAAPETVETASLNGVPIVESARADSAVTYEVGTSIGPQNEGTMRESAPQLSRAGETGGDPVVTLDPTRLAESLEAGERAAREAALTEALAAEAAAFLDENRPMSAPETPATDRPSSTANELNAQSLAQLETQSPPPAAGDAPASDPIGPDAEADPVNRVTGTAAPAQLTAPEAPDAVDPDEIIVVEATAPQLAAEPAAAQAISDAETQVSAEAAPQGRVPAMIRMALEPVYPARCESEAAASEVVVVAYDVSRYGKVLNPQVAESSNACFDRSAVAAVARWDFFPAQENGENVFDSRRTSRVVFQRP